MAGGLDDGSVLVTVSVSMGGFAKLKGLEEELMPSLLGCWPKVEVNVDVAAEADASGGVGLTEGFPKLKPVDVEGWPKPETEGFS